MSLLSGRNPVPLRGLMLLVSLCLLPGTLLHAWQFGVVVWAQLGWCVLFALLLEVGLLRLRGCQIRAGLSDMSWLVLALILARSLPLLLPVWMIALGCFAAQALCKHGCGGLGRNRLNPAMVGLGILAICFSSLNYPHPSPERPWTHALGVEQVVLQQLQLVPRLTLDAVSGATSLSLNQIDQLTPDKLNISGVGYALGGLALALLRVIRIEIPLAMIAGSLLFSMAVGHGAQASLYSLGLGGYVITAFFIATDPVTSPDTRLGRILFGALIGILTALIREYGLYADGLCFAVLVANLLVPQLDRLGLNLHTPWYRGRSVPTIQQPTASGSAPS